MRNWLSAAFPQYFDYLETQKNPLWPVQYVPYNLPMAAWIGSSLAHKPPLDKRKEMDGWMEIDEWMKKFC